MNIFLWVLQIVLALHTLMGAVWKFSHSEQTVPELSSIPHGVWVGMMVLEMLCSLGLLLPVFSRSLMMLVPIAAVGIAVEMLGMGAVNLCSGNVNVGHLAYWCVVTAVCGMIVYGRVVAKVI